MQARARKWLSTDGEVLHGQSCCTAQLEQIQACLGTIFSLQQWGLWPQGMAFPQEKSGMVAATTLHLPACPQPCVPTPRALSCSGVRQCTGWGQGWDTASASHPIRFPGQVAVPDDGNTLDNSQPVLQGHKVEVCNLHRWPDTVIGHQGIHVVLQEKGAVSTQRTSTPDTGPPNSTLLGTEPLRPCTCLATAVSMRVAGRG